MSGQITTEEYNAQISAASGGRFSHEESLRILESWVADEYPGVGEVLDAIEAAGVRTAVLSNTNEAHWALIEAEPARYPNILRHGSIFTSHVLRLAKPDLAIFAAVEAATGVPGSRVLFFDDVLENVEAARSAGWQAEHIDHTADSTAPQLLSLLRAHGVVG
jgi:putative hydrolase of the HAD superfamily